ncbi:MAG: N-acetylmuramoyl-L-alanine amidase [Elusimicrobia bacterium]|nr:N-acetylmuramoyl-L-alanine amidase [Elusimicrobiota bacterium]
MKQVAALLALFLVLPAEARSKHKMKGEPPPEQFSRVAPTPPLYPARSTEPIVFVWPPEGLTLSAEGEFIFGSVSPATAPFTINGATIPAHPNGAFLAWLPVTPGTFTFHAELTLSSGTAVADRHIFIPIPPAAAPPGDKPVIEPASLFPKNDLELRAGDWLAVRAKGTPGKPARWRFDKGPWQDMREAAPGSYESIRQVSPGESVETAAITYELGKGWSAAKITGAARLTITSKAPAIATIKTSTTGFANVKTGPGNGFLIFPLPGTRLPVTGRDGSALRVKVSDALSGWVDAKEVDLSSGMPPRAVTGTINVVKTDAGAVCKIGLSEKAAFDVEPAAGLDGLTLRLYNAVGHTNWVMNDAADFVQEVRWRQEASDTVAVTILLKPGMTVWGWWPSYEGNMLKLEIRRAPKISAKNPLAGIKIMLDPGHMPSATGSTGPMGTREMDANYVIAMAAKTRLEQAGATALVTRADPLHEVSLVERPRQAVERGADLFVSLHNNALPDGENPFSKPRGFTVFYYHPHSLELGRAVREAYRARINLPDEGLRWGNLLVARQSAMPAILVENAYMIFPNQEALLNDASFRDELARALVEGIESFLVSVRKSQ